MALCIQPPFQIISFIYSSQLSFTSCSFLAYLFPSLASYLKLFSIELLSLNNKVQAMDLLYAPPIREEAECNFLQENFLTCLKQKSVKDNVPEMKCNVQNILWFNLECPERFEDYRNPLKLRSIFANVKKGKGLDRPAYVKL